MVVINFDGYLVMQSKPFVIHLKVFSYQKIK